MTDYEKAKKIYEILFPPGTERPEDIPSFEELASLVSEDSVAVSFCCKIGKKKPKLVAEVSFPHEFREEKNSTGKQKEYNMKLALFLIVLGLAAVGAYKFFRRCRKDRIDDSRTSSLTETRPQLLPSPEGKKYLLLAFEMNTLADDAHKLATRNPGESFQVTNGRDLYDKKPRLLADQSEQSKEQIKTKALSEKPSKGQMILGATLSGEDMADFRKGKGVSVQRGAFENRLTGKFLTVLGFMEEEAFRNTDFYDIG